MIAKVLKQLTEYVEGKESMSQTEVTEMLNNLKEFLQTSMEEEEKVYAFENQIAALVFKALVATASKEVKSQIDQITEIIEESSGEQTPQRA